MSIPALVTMGFGVGGEIPAPTNNLVSIPFIGELFENVELYDEVELTSSTARVIVNPKNVIKVSRKSNTLTVGNN